MAVHPEQSIALPATFGSDTDDGPPDDSESGDNDEHPFGYI